MSSQNPSKIKCKTCGQLQDEKYFTLDRGYRRRSCNNCRAATADRSRQAENNRKIHQLISWPAAFLLMLAIYSYDWISGQNRVCIYESVYGQHSLTISVLRMCPLTLEV